MKKTYTINLSGKIFHVDDDALEKLQSYIDALKNHYSKEEDDNEIMDDIENRIGELFTEYLKGEYREVVTLEDVNKAINIMGTPDAIFEEDIKPKTPSPKQSKKLYRDADDGVLGGVASGLAAYLGLPRTLVRICFVFLTLCYGMFLPVYIILWIVVPKAKTARQKLEMKGEYINVSNIERSIKEEYQEFKNGKGAGFMHRCEKDVSSAVQIVGQVLSIVLGIGLFAGSIFALFTLLSVVFLAHLFPWGENFAGMAYAFTKTNLVLAKIALLILGIVPILSMIFVSVKLLFKFKSNNKIILLSALAVWLIGFVMLIFVGISEGRTWSPQSAKYREILDVRNCKTLVVNINDRYSPAFPAFNGVYHFKKDSNINLLQRPKLIIKPSEDSFPKIVVNYRTFKESEAHQNPDFNWNYQNDTLSFDNFFNLEGQWRGQQTTVSILIPEDMTLQFTPQTATYLKRYNQLEWQIRSQLDSNRLRFVMHDGQLQPVL